MDAQATSTKTGSQDGSLKLTNREDLGSRFRMVLVENLGSQAQAPAASGPNTKYHDVCVVCVVCVVWLVLWCCGGVQDFRGCSPTSLLRTPCPHPRTRFRRTAQNFALFFPSPTTIFIDWVLTLNFGPRTPNVHISGPRRFKHPQISTKGPPREREERKNMWQERKKKKSAKFWAPTLRGSTLWGPTLRGPTFSKFGPKMDWPKMDWPKMVKKGWPKMDWPKTVSALLASPVRGPDFWAPPYGPTLAKIGAKIGHQNTMAKNGLAKIGLAKVGHDRPEGVGPGRVGGPTFRAFFFHSPTS